MALELTESENAVLGMLCGGIEVTALQWMNYLKNAKQQSLPFTMNPRVLYRGFPSNLINMGGCTMWQFTVCGMLKNFFTGGSLRQLSAGEEVLAGFGAGVSSAFLGGPLELCMIQQQRKGGSILVRGSELIRNGHVLRGFTQTAMREGLWSVGYLSLPPVLIKALRTNMPETFTTNDRARAPAALLGALVSTLGSHPFDTIKTCMQGDVERQTYKNVVQSFKHMYQQNGIAGFYRGVEWRYGRQVCAVYMLDKLRDELGPIVFPDKFKNTQDD